MSGRSLEGDLRGINRRLKDVWQDLELTVVESRERGEQKTWPKADRVREALRDLAYDVGNAADRAAGLQEADE
jgi:hypothetical protein